MNKNFLTFFWYGLIIFGTLKVCPTHFLLNNFFLNLTWTKKIKGFGDLVPGQSRNDKYAGLKQLTVCFYSLFGMSIFGMCMSVTHYVARRKLMWLFAKIRLWFSCFDRRKPEKPTIKSPQDLNETLMEKEREKETILNRLKLLQHYEKAISAKRRKRHVLSWLIYS